MTFRYRFVIEGNPQGWTSKEGVATAEHLALEETTIDYADIVDSVTRDNRLILMLSPAAVAQFPLPHLIHQSNLLFLQLPPQTASKVERTIDRAASRIAAEIKRQALAAVGQDHRFRTAVCPNCAATIDLTDTRKTRHIYCRFCRSVVQEEEVVTCGDHYHVCEECGMFDRVRGYTEFYFYFLFIIYGFRYKRRVLCDACALAMARKMFWTNLAFILGIFPAVHASIKARTGRLSMLAELAQANKLARQGDVRAADEIYSRLAVEARRHPGIFFNQAMAHLHGRDSAGAVEYLGESLKACGNFAPTLRLLRRMQQATLN